MIPADQIGPGLHEPLRPGEFRWRPYGYIERPVQDRPGQTSPVGPVTVALLSDGIDPHRIARRAGIGNKTSWRIEGSWRRVIYPPAREADAKFASRIAAVVVLAASFIALKGVLPMPFKILVPALLAVAVMLATGKIVREAWEKYAESACPSDRTGVLWFAFEPQHGGGYGDMLEKFDQMTEAHRRDLVLDSTWTELHSVVVTAMQEATEHHTPADEANAPWVRAMRALDQARTQLGEQGWA